MVSAIILNIYNLFHISIHDYYSNWLVLLLFFHIQKSSTLYNIAHILQLIECVSGLLNATYMLTIHQCHIVTQLNESTTGKARQYFRKKSCRLLYN